MTMYKHKPPPDVDAMLWTGDNAAEITTAYPEVTVNPANSTQLILPTAWGFTQTAVPGEYIVVDPTPPGGYFKSGTYLFERDYELL